MEVKYNYFFYPNACHICKRFGKEVSLKRCGNCTMISYCSKEHQKIHWSQHKDLCNAIHNVLKDNKISSFLNHKQLGILNTEAWVNMRMNFMLMVAIKLGRKLEYYEEQMFKFLRSCIICHDQNVKVLEDCPNCPNTSFCTKHKNDVTHKKFCNLLKLGFDLDVITVMYERKIRKIKVPCRTNYVNLPQSMKDFIDCYTESQNDPHVSMIKEIMINAEYLTRPLTFLYAIQKLGYPLRDNSITIHVIATNIIDTDGIELWEILLHWLPSITIVKICLIGPELLVYPMSISLCENCQYNNKQLSIQMYSMLYKSYAVSDSYIKPNFIIGYNAGIHETKYFKSEDDTWSQSVKIIAEQNCPFVLTSYTLTEGKEEQIKLNRILNSHIKCTYFEQNPYSSLRPYRDFETFGVYYQNQYIIIYENLNTLP